MCNWQIPLCARFGDQARRLYDELKRTERERIAVTVFAGHAPCVTRNQSLVDIHSNR
jgi:hypothetical protein